MKALSQAQGAPLLLQHPESHALRRGSLRNSLAGARRLPAAPSLRLTTRVAAAAEVRAKLAADAPATAPCPHCHQCACVSLAGRAHPASPAPPE